MKSEPGYVIQTEIPWENQQRAFHQSNTLVITARNQRLIITSNRQYSIFVQDKKMNGRETRLLSGEKTGFLSLKAVFLLSKRSGAKDKMTEQYLKTGKEILNPNWPEAKWNVSGLFIHDAVIQTLLSNAISQFGCRFVESVHGAPLVKWNSGRIQKTTLPPENLAKAFRQTLQEYEKMGVAVFYTFSNHIIDKEMLDDPSCNFMLAQLAEIHGEQGGIILSSELLSDYIRKKYPCLKQISSVVKVTMEEGKGKLAYYKQSEAKYDRVVVHPDDNFNMELLRELDPRKAEILVNEPCLINCQTRKQHYALYSEFSKSLEISPEELREFEDNVCKSVPFHKQIDHQGPKRRNCSLTVSELRNVYNMGFRHFKIQGRTDARTVFKYDLTRYAFEPDHIAPLMFKSDWPS